MASSRLLDNGHRQDRYLTDGKKNVPSLLVPQILLSKNEKHESQGERLVSPGQLPIPVAEFQNRPPDRLCPVVRRIPFEFGGSCVAMLPALLRPVFGRSIPACSLKRSRYRARSGSAGTNACATQPIHLMH
jgi:hypothetical protein